MTTQLRQYVTANLGYAFRASAYDDLLDVAGARRVLDRHLRFAATVLERIAVAGVDRSEFRPIDPSVVAAVLLAGTVHLGRPDVLAELEADLDEAVQTMLDLCLQGLEIRPGP